MMISIRHLVSIQIVVLISGCSLSSPVLPKDAGTGSGEQADSAAVAGHKFGTSELERKYFHSLSNAQNVEDIRRRLESMGFTVVGEFTNPAEDMILIYAETTAALPGTSDFLGHTRICVVYASGSIDVLVRRVFVEN